MSFAVLSRIVALVSVTFGSSKHGVSFEAGLANLLPAESFTSPYLCIIEHIFDLSVTRITAVRCFAAPDIGHFIASIDGILQIIAISAQLYKLLFSAPQ
jgi:hypothetical protein